MGPLRTVPNGPIIFTINSAVLFVSQSIFFMLQFNSIAKEKAILFAWSVYHFLPWVPWPLVCMSAIA